MQRIRNSSSWQLQYSFALICVLICFVDFNIYSVGNVLLVVDYQEVVLMCIKFTLWASTHPLHHFSKNNPARRRVIDITLRLEKCSGRLPLYLGPAANNRFK